MAVKELEQKTSVCEADVSSRTSLFFQNVELARSSARYFYSKRVCSDADYEDYLHYAYTGLLESIDRFDSTGGASFKTFASYRIKGAILNGIEKFSEYREQVAFRIRLREERLDSLGHIVRSADKDTLFDEMVGLTLDLAVGLMLEGAVSMREHIRLDSDITHNKYLFDQTKVKLLERVGALPEKEKFVIELHYFYHASFIDIATTLAVSKGRVSQLHKNAIFKLRKLFCPDDELNHYI